MPKNHAKQSHGSSKSHKMSSASKAHHVKELILPTSPNQFGTNALVDSDFDAKLVKHLMPYNTIGNQNFFWRTVYDAGVVSQVALSDYLGFVAFQLNQCSGYSDYTTVFDQYRLRAASITISPNYPTLPAPNVNPRLYTCFDYDDNAPITRLTLQQYDSCVIAPPGTGLARALVPRMAIAAYGNGVFTNYANTDPMWVDAVSSGLPHFGVKFVIEAGGTGQTILQVYTVQATCFWEFRSAR